MIIVTKYWDPMQTYILWFTKDQYKDFVFRKCRRNTLFYSENNTKGQPLFFFVLLFIYLKCKTVDKIKWVSVCLTLSRWQHTNSLVKS